MLYCGSDFAARWTLQPPICGCGVARKYATKPFPKGLGLLLPDDILESKMSVVGSVLIATLMLISTPVYAANRAVIIAVGRYDFLTIPPLVGPANDAALMNAVLRSAGLSSEHVVSLTDDSIETLLPRKANILRVLAETARRSRAGDNVVLYFSGHGAQIPQVNSGMAGRYIEPDGLDEVFITRDTRMWDKDRKRVDGALLDDEIGKALAAFTLRRVNVWVIFDSCHAGDMVRAAPRPLLNADIVWRGLAPETLGAPDADNLSGASGANRSLVKRLRHTAPNAKGRLLAFYATHPDEAAPEQVLANPRVLDSTTAGKSRFGFFTWAVANAIALQPKSFAQLSGLIAAQYSHMSTPTPMFEGELNRPLPFARRVRTP